MIMMPQNNVRRRNQEVPLIVTQLTQALQWKHRRQLQFRWHSILPSQTFSPSILNHRCVKCPWKPKKMRNDLSIAPLNFDTWLLLGVTHFRKMRYTVSALSLVSIWSSGSSRSPQSFSKYFETIRTTGAIGIPIWLSRHLKGKRRGVVSDVSRSDNKIFARVLQTSHINGRFLFVKRTSYLSICFFSWFCGIEKLEEFPEDIVSLRKLDVTDFL